MLQCATESSMESFECFNPSAWEYLKSRYISAATVQSNVIGTLRLKTAFFILQKQPLAPFTR